MPTYDIMVMRLIKSYFNLYDPRSIGEVNKKRSRRLTTRLKRLSTNRILVSKAELKHTANKILITLYVYNAQGISLTRKIKKLFPIFKVTNKKFLKRVRKIKDQGIKLINLLRKEKLLFDENITSMINFNNYDTQLYKKFIKKSLYKEILTMKYRRLLYFNKSKFETTRLLNLNKLINNIYGKSVEFNLVNLKYLYLNSDILTEAIAIKLKNKKNKLLKVLKRALSLCKVTNLKNKLSDIYNANNNKKQFLYKPSSNNDILDELLKRVFTQSEEGKEENKNLIQNLVINSVNNKSVTGIRLESSGRLTRRFTAARSVFKFRYKGSLKNINSSYKGLSSVVLRGHVKSNIQYTKISSKNRNGSFGIKG